MRPLARIIAVFAVVMLLSATGFYVLGKSLLRPKFDRLEVEQVQTLLRDVNKRVDNAVAVIDAATIQNSDWTGLYDEMAHDARSFLVENLGSTAAQSAGVSVEVVAYDSGDIAFESKFDWSKGRRGESPLISLETNLRGVPLLRNVFSGKPLRGVFQLDGRVVALSARPIEHSDGSKSGRGIVVFARELDRPWLSEASDAVHAKVEIAPIGHARPPATGVTERSGVLTGTAQLSGPTGTPVAVIRTQTAPQLDKLEHETIRNLTLFATLVSVAGAAALIFAVQRTARRQSDRFHSLVQNARDVIVLSDSRGVITYASPSAFSVFGHQPSALVGKSLDDWVVPDDGFDPQFAAWRAPTGTAAELMLRVRRADSTWALCEGHRTNLLREPAVKSMVLNLHDITERARASDEIVKARDAAVTAMNVKSQFLASMSHEIRTPLNGVLGLTELLLDTELSEEQRQYATSAYSAAENLLTIVNDILDFSKVEAGKLVVENARLDPGAILREVGALLIPQARAKGLAIEVQIDPALPESLVGDAQRLRQVLLNLTANAVKFTEAGSVTLATEVVAVNHGSVSLRFTVRDTGVGIAPGDRERIFGAFAQADSSVTRRYGGTGLGLAISKQFVELMGGDLRLASEVGRGSTFSFELTLQRDVADALSHEPMAKTDPKAATTELSVERVLLVEDNEVNQLVASRMLAKLGFVAEIASSGVEALDAIAQKKYRLVFMDCQMPIMDGYEATMRLRRRERESGGDDHLVVIAMTAAAMEGDRERCLRAGMDDYISKPLTLAALREVADRWRARGAATSAAPPTKSLASGVDSSPSIDVARIRELRELDAPDGAYVEQLVAAFLENAARIVQTLRDAVQEGDPQAVERAAHALKGSSANIGATRLAELAHLLETLGRGGALGKANDAVDATATELELLDHALRAALTAS